MPKTRWKRRGFGDLGGSGTRQAGRTPRNEGKGLPGEFLAVGSFVALTVYLRQRGSTRSKPVGAPHHSTGVEG